MTAGIADVELCGWRVRSDVALPDCLPWPGPSARPVDIAIRLGAVPDALPGTTHATPFLGIGGNGDCRLAIAAVASYLVRQGREVVVQPAPGASVADIGTFLLGSVLGLLVHQRGLFPLHASCVRMGEGAVAFCGPSGAGKSTLAAALVRRGHALVADDVSVIDGATPVGPVVLPAPPRLGLWRDSLDALDIDATALDHVRRDHDKFSVPAPRPGAVRSQPLPLRAVFVLQGAAAMDKESLHAEPPMETVALLTAQVYRLRQAYWMGRQASVFAGAAAVAATVPVRRLTRPLDFDRLPGLVAMVESTVAPWVA